MLEATSQEKKDQRTAMIVSVVFHVLLLLLLFYLMAWRAPNPPLPEYGIEVNFGLDAAGTGNVQSKAVANESPNRENSRPATTTPDPVKPEVQPQPTPSQPQTQQALSTDNDNEVSFKKEEVKPTPEPPKEEVKKVETPKAVYKGATKTNSAGTGTGGNSNTPTGNNNGDDDNAVGDKGDPRGNPDAKVYRGNPGGGGGGPQLDMPGWRYDVRPKEDPYQNESGHVKFRITINSEGEIENIQVVESTVAPQVVKWYRDEVYKTQFSRTTNKTPGDRGATGTITIHIRSK